MSRTRNWLIAGAIGLLLLIGGGLALSQHAGAKATPAATPAKQVKKAAPKRTKPKTTTTIDWKHPSQTKPYPTITAEKPVVLTVDLAKQRVYITQTNQLVYTMYCSTGINDTTPHGTFHIIDRGAHFYNPTEKMGAKYWTSFKGTTYLFHTVPTDQNGHYIASEAKFLGQKPSSHGCVRLSIPDAYWINQHVPNNTKVVIK